MPLTLPNDFMSRMQDMLGDEYSSFLNSYELPKYQSLRVNELKTNTKEFMDRYNEALDLSPVPWTDNGFYYPENQRPGKHPYHEAGVYYIQEPSAMAPAIFLEPKPGERILDLCAAPGGKSTQIASMMHQEGILISNEIHPARVKILSENIERMGISNAIVTNETPQNLASLFPSYFDRIAVDAPCSGEGMFRKNEEACSEWSLENVQICADRQDEILDCADMMLRPGGRIVYSTCTFAPLENEGSISRFLERHPDYEILDVPLFKGMSHGNPAWGNNLPSLSHTIRLWPHKLYGEGHFVAILQKKGACENIYKNPARFGFAQGVILKDNIVLTTNNKAVTSVKSKRNNTNINSEYKELEAFLNQELTVNLSGVIFRFGDQIYFLPEYAPALTRLRVIRPGLHLGTILKNRFEPSHALAHFLKSDQVIHTITLHSSIPEEYNQLIWYINGQTFPCNLEKGWYLITSDGYSIGWGKLAGGIMKNHYPKGLRKLL